MFFESEPLNVKIGEVHTPYHHVKLRVQTSCVQVSEFAVPSEATTTSRLRPIIKRSLASLNPSKPRSIRRSQCKTTSLLKYSRNNNNQSCLTMSVSIIIIVMAFD
jgi:hypothetical protein